MITGTVSTFLTSLLYGTKAGQEASHTVVVSPWGIDGSGGVEWRGLELTGGTDEEEWVGE
jgi:hypothetical protein